MDFDILKIDGVEKLEAAESAETLGQWFLVEADTDTVMSLSVLTKIRSQHVFMTAQSVAQSVSLESGSAATSNPQL